MRTLLSTRSSYSFLNSLLNIPQIVTSAKELGYQSVVLADIGVLYGDNQFHLECKKQDIKPIYGLQLFVENEVFFILAKNNQGFKQLMKLSQLLSVEPLTLETLSRYSSECIVIYSTENSSIEPLMAKYVGGGTDAEGNPIAGLYETWFNESGKNIYESMSQSTMKNFYNRLDYIYNTEGKKAG